MKGRETCACRPYKQHVSCFGNDDLERKCTKRKEFREQGWSEDQESAKAEGFGIV